MEGLMKKSCLLFISVCILFSGCNEDKKNANLSGSGKNSVEKESSGGALGAASGIFSEKNHLSFADFSASAHQQYLNDELVFEQVPDQGLERNCDSAVVGSRVCRIFPRESFEFTGTYEAVMKSNYEENAVKVPFSSLVKIVGPKLLNSADDVQSYAKKMFYFEDNYNWFYPVEWKGVQGYIFGADLYGLNRNLIENQISAELYRTRGKLDKFYPYLGYWPVTKNLKASLEKNRLAIMLSEKARGSYFPDDMVNLYQKIPRDATMFITTDLASHCNHLIFDKILQHVEEEKFFVRLQHLCNDFIQILKGSDEISQIAADYFTVPYLILKSAPEKIFAEDDIWQLYPIYRDVDITKLLNECSESVKADYNSVLNASGEISQILGTAEDFSQYKARGHYSKNKILTAYFKAQMWFGRINWVIADEYPENSKMAQVITYIVDKVHENPQLYEDWKSLFDPVTALIGESDDVSFNDIVPIWKDFQGNKADALAFMKVCHDKLRPPRISSMSVFKGPSEGAEHKPPMGWRFMGQRFVYDSYIHTELSAPRLFARDFVTGLDVLKVLGAKSADYILAQTEYEKINGFKEKIDALEEEFNNEPEEFWSKNYYNSVLYQIKTQSCFGQGSGFYFTETPAWNVKTLNAGLGTWAELRHDTILLAKHSFAERGGDGDFEGTFRTESLPVPVNYVEPNIPFWKGCLLSLQLLHKTLSEYALLDEEGENVLQGLKTIYSKCLAISEKEALDQEITPEENRWIRTIPNSLGRYILIYVPGESYENMDQFKMACIADVFTNSEKGVCLETGVGRPNMLYIPLNDWQGGKRIAIGYGFSYYEFYHPMNERLTDEEWKKIVYDGDDDMSSYIPVWAKSCIIK